MSKIATELSLVSEKMSLPVMNPPSEPMSSAPTVPTSSGVPSRLSDASSPLQFQKQLRLQEARHLMLGEDLDAASAGYRVGYSDASHFTREYKRLFGAPPVRDLEQLREAAVESATL